MLATHNTSSTNQAQLIKEENKSEHSFNDKLWMIYCKEAKIIMRKKEISSFLQLVD